MLTSALWLERVPLTIRRYLLFLVLKSFPSFSNHPSINSGQACRKEVLSVTIIFIHSKPLAESSVFLQRLGESLEWLDQQSTRRHRIDLHFFWRQSKSIKSCPKREKFLLVEAAKSKTVFIYSTKSLVSRYLL
jgi:hypothetical protein